MKFTSKKSLAEHYTNLILDTESIKRITIIIELENGDSISSRFCPKISKRCPTKKDRIIKEILSLIRNKGDNIEEPGRMEYKIKPADIKKISFRCEYDGKFLDF